ncbi:uncharacterized protein [Chiloscyllium punctatum]|uniref:uncharacterized protein n=1 Tax=Chiloscyllium punctatum TaxID=137246 RepID=UPI003B63277D
MSEPVLNPRGQVTVDPVHLNLLTVRDLVERLTKILVENILINHLHHSSKTSISLGTDGSPPNTGRNPSSLHCQTKLVSPPSPAPVRNTIFSGTAGTRSPIPQSPGHTRSSADERAVREVKSFLLRALNLQHIPRTQVDTVRQLRTIWRARLQATSLNLQQSTAQQEQPVANATQPQSEVSATPDNETTATSLKLCCQTAAQISLTDLGWEHWILYPEQITYVACASCRHTRDLVSPRCRQDRPTKGSRTGKRSCCKAVKTVWIPIVYVDEDLSLVTSNIPLTEECGW